jgi:hypothetical protein
VSLQEWKFTKGNVGNTLKGWEISEIMTKSFSNIIQKIKCDSRRPQKRQKDQFLI